jgi:hypothetical protein
MEAVRTVELVCAIITLLAAMGTARFLKDTPQKLTPTQD